MGKIDKTSQVQQKKVHTKITTPINAIAQEIEETSISEPSPAKSSSSAAHSSSNDAETNATITNGHIRQMKDKVRHGKVNSEASKSALVPGAVAVTPDDSDLEDGDGNAINSTMTNSNDATITNGHMRQIKDKIRHGKGISKPTNSAMAPGVVAVTLDENAADELQYSGGNTINSTMTSGSSINNNRNEAVNRKKGLFGKIPQQVDESNDSCHSKPPSIALATINVNVAENEHQQQEESVDNYLAQAELVESGHITDDERRKIEYETRQRVLQEVLVDAQQVSAVEEEQESSKGFFSRHHLGRKIGCICLLVIVIHAAIILGIFLGNRRFDMHGSHDRSADNTLPPLPPLPEMSEGNNGSSLPPLPPPPPPPHLTLSPGQ